MFRRGCIVIISLIIVILAGCTDTQPEMPTLIAGEPTATRSPIEITDPPAAPLSTDIILLSATHTLTATITPTETASISPTMTVTPSQTITDTPSPTMTPLPTINPAERPLFTFVLTAGAFTPLPDDFIVPTLNGTQPFTLSQTPVANTGATALPGNIGVPPTVPPPPVIVTQAATCPFFPPGNFGTLYTSNPDLAAQLGCTAENPPNVLTVSAAVQDFENGLMLWLEGDIYVLNTVSDSYQHFADTFTDGTDPENSSEIAPAGLTTPRRGFLKVWANNPAVQNSLGWALSDEQGTDASILRFANGLMIAPASRASTLILIRTAQGTGTWRAVQ